MKVFLNLDLTLKVLKLMRLKMYTKAAILKLIGSVQEYPATEPLDKIPSLRSKRFRLVSKQRKTEERDSRLWPR